MKDVSQIKVAIVHDWLVGGGAENVVLELHRMFPGAPIYTSYCTAQWRGKLGGKAVTGFLQYWPFSRLRKFLPLLRIWWFTHLHFAGYDLVISSSGNGEAKGIKVPAGAKHICYCHSPTHYYWRHYEQYLQNPGFGLFNPLARLGLRLLVGPLRRWDLKAAKRPDIIIANSTHIQNDIKKYYGRDSVVIHPPVDIARFQQVLSSQPSAHSPQPLPTRHGFITVGRQVPYKRVDIIVKACSKLNLPLTVIGDGPEHKNLVRVAGPSIKFLTSTSDKDVTGCMANAKAFIMAAFEDFGITPVEAMAAGTPVIAYKAGGALDYVIPGKTGEFFTEQTAESLTNCLKSFKPDDFSQKDIANYSEKFNKQSFELKFKDTISKFAKENNQ